MMKPFFAFVVPPVLLGVFVVWMLAAFCPAATAWPTPQEIVFANVANDRHKAALRFHGIRSAYLDADGWRFVRHGKKCRLFTDDFEKHYADRREG